MVTVYLPGPMADATRATTAMIRNRAGAPFNGVMAGSTWVAGTMASSMAMDCTFPIVGNRGKGSGI